MQEQKDSWDAYTWADPLYGWVSALSGRSALDTAFFAWERLTQQRKGRIPRRLQHGQLRHAVKLWLKCARDMRCVGLRLTIALYIACYIALHIAAYIALYITNYIARCIALPIALYTVLCITL